MVDASSKFQASLPVTPKELVEKLTELNLEFQPFNHEAVRTVAESKKVEKLFIRAECHRCIHKST